MKIEQDIIERVRKEVSIVELLQRMGVELRRCGGGNYEAHSPFREDKHIGSFKVSETRNIAYDFATQECWDPIDAVIALEHKPFTEAVGMLAKMIGITVEGYQGGEVERLKMRPVQGATELPVLLRTMEGTTNYYMGREAMNPLMVWLRSLPLKQKMVDWAIKAYQVGTASNGRYKGWTVWWNIDEIGYVRTGKLMAYMSNGHRDKSEDGNGLGKTMWAHTLWARAGMYDTTKYRAVPCAFGLHLLKMYPEAQVCVVESEKTAVICSTFCDPRKRIWIATGGLSSLRVRLKPVMDMFREIVLYPDHDGEEKWIEEAKKLNYEKVVVIGAEGQGWKEEDGEKADIADILVREILDPETKAKVEELKQALDCEIQ